MKNIIKKSVTTIVIIALALSLAVPVTAETKSKTPKLSKTKITLTITKKKTKPTYKLKVKNAAQKKVKWTSNNKKVAVVSKSGKVTAKKKGIAVITAKVNGRKLRCKISVKDTRRKNSDTDTVTHKHDYFKSSWIYPTCDLDGEVNYCCSICYYKYTEVIPATGHSYVEESRGIESFTGKSFVKYQCTKCDRWYTQYPGPPIDYKKPHIHCHCGMDFNDIDEYSIHALYADLAGEYGHSCYNWLCCLV